MADNSGFMYHPNCKRIQLTHLYFVDDIMHFSRWDLSSVKCLKDCMDVFGRVSGLHMNNAKSEI